MPLKWQLALVYVAVRRNTKLQLSNNLQRPYSIAADLLNLFESKEFKMNTDFNRLVQ